MTKELSIESIKKEIMDKLLNNVDIINYFKVDIEQGVSVSELYNNLIFDYESSYAVGDYITVEVSEYDSHRATKNGDMAYMVTIKMGLKNEEDVCAMSTVVAGIVNKLYPDRKRFSNIAFKSMDNNLSVNNYGWSNVPEVHRISLENRRDCKLHRMIMFELE